VSRSVNKVTLLGNLGSDPEVRSTNNGSRVATLALATSRKWKDGRGEMQEKTQWHRIICWNNPKGPQLADIAEQYCRKGGKLYIEGEIEYRSWDDKDGVKRYTTEITCRELVLLGGDGEQAERKPAPAKSNTKRDTFDDVPEALDAEDDDLPF
jgi:single-strand DNA-binding protein